jgi:hypothetical protein
MPSQSPQTSTTLVVRIYQKQQKLRPSGNSPLLTPERGVFAPGAEKDSSQCRTSVASKIDCQNSTPSSLLKNSGIADIIQCMTLTPSTILRRSMITPTAMRGTCSHRTPAPGGPAQTYLTRGVVSSLASGIASTFTPLRCLENLPTPIPNPKACATITNALRARATERNQRQWHL